MVSELISLLCFLFYLPNSEANHDTPDLISILSPNFHVPFLAKNKAYLFLFPVNYGDNLNRSIRSQSIILNQLKN